MCKGIRLKKAYSILSLAILGGLIGCIDKNEISQNIDPVEGIEGIQVSDAFEYRTAEDVGIDIDITFDSEAVDNVKVSIYDGMPPNEYESDSSRFGQLLTEGYTNDQGEYTGFLNLSSDISEVVVVTAFPGLPEMVVGTVANNTIQVSIDEDSPSLEITETASGNPTGRTSLVFSYLDGYNFLGVPNNVQKKADKITKQLLKDIDKALPEQDPVPKAHPQYLKDGIVTDILLQQEADVWITFISEGAGYRNSMGFYTYQISNPPQSAEEIEELVIAYPNTSFSGSGGGLKSGDKVHIGKFPGGTGIGWFIVADGWTSSGVGDGKGIFYSNEKFNPESTREKRIHNVLLNDLDRENFILGFEDIQRETFSDEDFNDAVFNITMNPPTAVIIDNTETVQETAPDDDMDDVFNSYDAYPNDPTKAFDNYYPGKNSYGTLAFEDLWPNKGDYDFNDLVVDYQFNQVTNKDNQVIEIKARFVVKAIGAGFANGLGFQMNGDPGIIQNVAGSSLEEGIITLDANNTEIGQDKPTIIVFDNAYNILPHPGGQGFVNTQSGTQYVTPDTVDILITFTTPQAMTDIGLPPYNPFMIINRERGKEVHLPGYAPTNLADESYFGTGSDDTNVANGKYYKSDGNLPWGMNFPDSFDYPQESSDISEAHLTFREWVQSDGFSRQDWYKNNVGYRNNNKIFKK